MVLRSVGRVSEHRPEAEESVKSLLRSLSLYRGWYKDAERCREGQCNVILQRLRRTMTKARMVAWV